LVFMVKLHPQFNDLGDKYQVLPPPIPQR